MYKVNNLILLAVVYSALIAATLILPVWVAIPAGLAVTYIICFRKKQERAGRIDKIKQRMINLRSEGLVIAEKVSGVEEDVFYRMIMTLLNDLERSAFKLVEKNIQLLSLKEIGRNIVSSLEEEKLIDSVFDYLVRGVRYKEAAVILLRKKQGRFQAIVCIEKATRVIRKVINFSFDEVNGAIYKSLITGKPYLIKDVNMHPMMTFGGDELFSGSTMTSYLCVPLMKTGTESVCEITNECLLKKHMKGDAEQPGMHYLQNGDCLSCTHIPLLGAIIVSDGFRANPLTNIDQVTIETVGSLVSSNIENWLLYQDLRKEEVFREKVIEGMINGIFVIDLDGKITLANRSARVVSRFKREGLLGKRIDSVIIERGGEGESEIFRVLREDVSRSFYEAYLKRKDGVHVPIRMNISTLLGEDGLVEGAIIGFVDLSEIKRMEEEIRHLDRLAVLGRFTSAVAHEIRNPLTGIAAGIQYLNRDSGLNDEQRENISFILNEVDRLNNIITDLFKIAKPRKLLYQKVSLTGLIERSLKSVGDIIENKRIDFQKEIDDNLNEIEVDPDLIVQVMINLIKNSAEAVCEEGIIGIKATHYEGGDQDIMLEKEKDMVLIEFSDNGEGIEPSDRGKVFEPFFTKKKGGTGLGLFISHSIIQHHQGRINVTSEVCRGTTFKVYLPMTGPRKGAEIETGSPTR